VIHANVYRVSSIDLYALPSPDREASMSPMNLLIRYLMRAVVGLFPSTVLAVELSIHVIDQHGEPVSNAVVEIPVTPVVSAPDEVAIIDQIDKRFTPMVIAIQQGQQVNFPNNDNIRHHVYSFSDIKQFSTELYEGIPGDPILFDQSGVAVLGCNIHDSMVGYIFVSEWQQVAVSDNEGVLKFELEQIPATVSVWHPWSSNPQNPQEINTTMVDSGLLEIQLNIEAPEQNFGFRALRNR